MVDENGKKLITNNRCGMVIMICHQFLKKISPTSQWQQRINQLFAEYPNIPLFDMGLPDNWQEHPLWTS
jgi:abortive infection bacteriophage resistance protein